MNESQESQIVMIKLLQNMTTALGEIYTRLDSMEAKVNIITQNNTTCSDILMELSELKSKVTDMSSTNDSLESASSCAESFSAQVPDKSCLIIQDTKSPLLDKGVLEKYLKCPLSCTAVPANSFSQDNLDTVLQQVKESDNHYDFVIIQPPPSILDTPNPPPASTISSFVSKISDIKPKTPIYLGCLPPRYDSKHKASMVKAYNQLWLAEAALMDRFTPILQDKLHCLTSSRQRLERYTEDNINITEFGKKLFTKNISMQLIAELWPPETELTRPKNKHSIRYKSKNSSHQLLNKLLLEYF